MNDEDIKKALECCISTDDCKKCPLGGTHQCYPTLEKNALDLIYRQQAEIERLQKYNTEVAFKHYDDGRTEAIKECVNKYTEMLIDEYHLRTDLQIASIKRLEQKVLTEMVGGENEKSN